jgi:hypothetical protein
VWSVVSTEDDDDDEEDRETGAIVQSQMGILFSFGSGSTDSSQDAGFLETEVSGPVLLG